MMEILADLEYEERGAGEVVYLVHAGVHSAWFAPMFGEPALDGCRVIRPIRPGYGRNPAPAGHRSLADHARACGRLLRELGVQRAHWVGQSSSCCIGLQAALDDPGLVASLILFEPAKPSGPLREQYASGYVAPALKAAADGDPARAFDVFLRGVAGDGYRAGLRTKLDDAAIAEAQRESEYFFADEMPALREWTFGAAEGAAVSAPTLILRGSDTRPFLVENVDLLAAMIPGARIVTIPGADHIAPFTRPAQVATVIADFVRQHSSAPVPGPA
jgi:pimeloyl-ACP methyl ester carboxylesterase